MPGAHLTSSAAAIGILCAGSAWLASSELLPMVMGALIIGTIVGPAFSLINLGFAWRQWREGSGTALRLCGVCVSIAILQILPLVLFLFVFSFRGRSMQDQTLPAGILVVWNWILLTMSIGRPVRLAHSRDELPLVKDEPFQRRVRELASAMGLKTPVVRMVRSLSGEQQAAAFAGGLPAPSLVVTDGILHRLAPDERDAVVGHELAHLANGSLWWLTCVTPVAACGGLVAAAAGGGWFGVLFGLALRTGLLRIVSRWFERDCDRRAADAIGYRTMCSALRKIHAVHVVRDDGWRSVVVYATSTHPSRAERLAALAHAAPEDEQPAQGSNSIEYQQRTLAARTAAVVWIVALILSMGGRLLQPESIWPVVILIVVLTVPFWPLLDVWGRYRRIGKRTRQGNRRRTVGLILLAISVIAHVIVEQSVGAATTTLVVIQLLIGMCALFGFLLMFGGVFDKAGRVRRKLLTALQNHDFETAARIGADHQRVVARSADLTHNVAVARILSGDLEGGICQLRSNAERHPKFAQSLLTLAAFCFDAGDYEAAGQAASQAELRLKYDPAPRVQRAAALWRLGQLEGAESLAREVMDLDPDSGLPHLVLAGVAIARGDEHGAREALETAERLAPGLPAARVIEAEAALRFDGPAVARHAIERARETARNNPFAVINGQVDRLDGELQSSDERCTLTEA